MAKRGPKPRPASERFMRHVLREGDHWIWIGCWNKSGFRMLNGMGSVQEAQKWHPKTAAWHLFGPGTRPRPGEGLFSRCGEPRCVNPEHLIITNCGRRPDAWDPAFYACGHPRTEKNTWVMAGRSRCKTCHRRRTERWAKRNQKLKAEINRRAHRRWADRHKSKSG